MERIDKLAQTFLATADMVTEARKIGFNVDRALNLLRTAKSVLNEAYLKREIRDDLLQHIEQLLQEAHAEIFSVCGEEFTEKWDEIFKRIMKGEKYGEFKIEKMRFAVGLPRDRRWIRVKSLEDEILKEIKEVAEVIETKEGYVICGENLKEALEIMRKHMKK